MLTALKIIAIWLEISIWLGIEAGVGIKTMRDGRDDHV